MNAAHRISRSLVTTGALAALLILIFLPSDACASLIPPFFINSVVALGTLQTVNKNGQVKLEWVTEGTGFFYAYLTEDDPDPNKRRYLPFLVTAKHVVQEHIAANLGELLMRVNPTNSSARSRDFAIPNAASAQGEAWFFHPDDNIDVAAVPINFKLLEEAGIGRDVLASDQHAANSDKLISLGVTAGDGIFVLGFPMNLAGEERNYVIVRQGAVARISEMLDHASPTFMIDAFAFPGNSGSPVVLKPELTAIEGTKAQLKAYLIGMVLSYHPYEDVAVSTQTRQRRVTFQENSGLAEVLPIDYVDQAISAWLASRGQGTLQKP